MTFDSVFASLPLIRQSGPIYKARANELGSSGDSGPTREIGFPIIMRVVRSLRPQASVPSASSSLSIGPVRSFALLFHCHPHNLGPIKQLNPHSLAKLTRCDRVCSPR